MKVNQAGSENKKQRVSGFSQTGREKREKVQFVGRLTLFNAN